jgi:hypothetical protein
MGGEVLKTAPVGHGKWKPIDERAVSNKQGIKDTKKRQIGVAEAIFCPSTTNHALE